jgi:hypothetical protein
MEDILLQREGRREVGVATSMCLEVLERMLKGYDLENWGVREVDNMPGKRLM